MTTRATKRLTAVIVSVLTFVFCFTVRTAYAANDYLFNVRLGGYPIAFSLDVDGVIVDEVGFVQTEAGNATFANKLRRGDLIVSVDDEKIEDSGQIRDYLKNTDGEPVELGIVRNGEKLNVELIPFIDLNGTFELGISMRDKISGAGMTTFTRDNGFFAALGHKVIDSVAGDVPISGGEVFRCEIGGISKSKRGKPGELLAYVKGGKIGEVLANTDYGLFGIMVADSGAEIQTASVANVKPGKAYVYTTVSETPKMYEIEIIKASQQDKISEKGMVIRITDKELLELTGGITQGMSGSPILQDGKLVGAITHVFTADPTKGYGIYAQWMRKN